jgi:RimJ/RimL family protein N-acetyltransferase
MVKLRRLTSEDAHVIADLLNNKSIWDCLRDYIPFPYSVADAEEFIKKCVLENPPLTFGIEKEEEICGVIALVPQSDVYRHSAEVGYWIGEPYWGQGIATAALRLMLNHAFQELELKRLFAGVFDFNQASCRVLEKAGFAQEGRLKKAVVKNGIWCDEFRYGLVDDARLP